MKILSVTAEFFVRKDRQRWRN